VFFNLSTRGLDTAVSDPEVKAIIA